jgi:hypothetical protein
MQRLLIELLVLVVLSGGGWLAWEHHDHTEQADGIAKQVAVEKAASAKQEAIDAKKLQEAETRHAKELSDIQTQYLRPITTAHVLCYSTPATSSVSAKADSANPSGPSGNGGQSNVVHPDISYALDVFAHRLDILNAQARQVNLETHP